MPTVPEFILRKLFVQGSLKTTPNGFSFVINNTFAPARVTSFQLHVDGKPVDPGLLELVISEAQPIKASQVNPENPLPLSVDVPITLLICHTGIGSGKLHIQVDTIEAGLLAFTILAKGSAENKSRKKTTWALPKFFQSSFKVNAIIDSNQMIGEINPFVYGHFIEHLERCIYGGIWDENGSSLRQDTLALIKEIKPPIIRYPGGNFASGYHWEDGIGSQEKRPARFDSAWQHWETNRVGTDEFIDFCRLVNCEPFLVVNDGSGTAEEAARWVAYCNEPSTGQQGKRRTANGHAQPHHVRIWGIGNEVWGRWQIGHTGPQEYALRLVEFAKAMRAVDPDLHLVAVGDKVLSDAPNDPGLLWNETVLKRAGHLIDDISFHLYQPDQEGWREEYDPDQLHHIICAAPLAAERIIQRIAAQAKSICPDKNIRIAFDEWNLWLPPPADAESMHHPEYTMRDALYIAGMLNAFQRQCNLLSMANLAQLVNVLPLIVTNQEQAFASSLYYPFLLYTAMQNIALKTTSNSLSFNSPALGTITAVENAPYVDISATRNEAGKRLVFSILNRHPSRKSQVDIELKGFTNLHPVSARILHTANPLEKNDFSALDKISPKAMPLPEIKNEHLKVLLPPVSVAMFVLEQAA